ncbi:MULTISPECIES: hypothetical protein [unclassified Micromonospora]|uniref:hypothetical protein n=1 Tax=unclassified Micromonospora TaxID=2617518 RepID=UPI003A86D63B
MSAFRTRPIAFVHGIKSNNAHAHAAAHPSAWFTGYRRLTIRYERDPGLYCAFVTLAAALTCHKRYITLTT